MIGALGPPDEALQRTRLSGGSFSWRSVRVAELGRYLSTHHRRGI